MVEPLKPAVRQQALKRGTEEELAEYERLLLERFETDPSAARESPVIIRRRNQRLAVLGRKLFGKGHNQKKK